MLGIYTYKYLHRSTDFLRCWEMGADRTVTSRCTKAKIPQTAETVSKLGLPVSFRSAEA